MKTILQMSPSLLQWKMQSPVGPLYLVASESGLQGVFWKKQLATMTHSLQTRDPATQHIVQALKQLQEYFRGDRREFDLQLEVKGTEFQKKVWGQLAKIPYGQTQSYRDVAQKIKQEKAFRAVGTANGRNPLSIIVPCHRVIAADGTLGGYAGGLKIKNHLLALERQS
ncbi:MAG: methylated-DNA--[protein]-cysteine S-methyltransferase [Bdellovibrio sp.]|jgi:methylated-DNA-[protein]-cysteine S-methyltransferase